MLSVTTLYNEYIDRRNMLDQENPVEQMVPPPLKWVGIINSMSGEILQLRVKKTYISGNIIYATLLEFLPNLFCLKIFHTLVTV